MYKSTMIVGLAGLAAASAPAGYPAAYGSSSSAAPSSAAAYPSSSSAVPSAYPSASSSLAAYPSSSGAAWSSSAPAGYPSSSAGPVSSSAPVYPSSVYPSSTSTVSIPPSATPTCWTTCFEASDITSEAELCGNEDVNKCIYYGCSKDDDMKYWAWYQGACPATSSSATPPCETTLITYSSTTVTTTYPVTSASATPTADCWSTCFAENNVESEASLCGNTAVSACIAETCSSELDKAYWEWYNSYCTPAEGTTTLTSVCSETTSTVVTSGITTYTTVPISAPWTSTWATTNTVPSVPKSSSPVTTGWPTAPVESSPATYTSPSWTTPYSYVPGVAGPTGTGVWASASATPSGYVPVPATGAGAANKAGGVLAVIVAAVAFL